MGEPACSPGTTLVHPTVFARHNVGAFHPVLPVHRRFVPPSLSSTGFPFIMGHRHWPWKFKKSLGDQSDTVLKKNIQYRTPNVEFFVQLGEPRAEMKKTDCGATWATTPPFGHPSGGWEFCARH
jgi:hypothetical protein